MEPDDWFTYLIRLNYRFDNISDNFKNTDKQLSIHIMKNMCDEYNKFKILI